MARFQCISVASDGSLWGVYGQGDGSYRPVQYVPANNAWVDRGAGLTEEGGFMWVVAVGSGENVWGTTYPVVQDIYPEGEYNPPQGVGRAYRWNPATLAWERVRNPEGDAVILAAVAAGADGTVLASARNLDGPGVLFRYVGGNDPWTSFPGTAAGQGSFLSVGAQNNVWAVTENDSGGLVLARYTGDGGWQTVPGASKPNGDPRSVSAAADTTTWYATSGGSVFAYNYTTQQWVPVPGGSGICFVAVQSAQSAYGLDAGGGLYQWRPSSGWTKMVEPSAAAAPAPAA